MKRINYLMLMLGVLGGLSMLSAAPITIYNTGVCAGANAANINCTAGVLNNGEFDNNFQLILRSDAGTTGANSSVTTAPVPGWVPANATSAWISPVPNTGNFPNGATFTYQQTFSLAGFQESTLVLLINVAIDNLVQVRINGGSTSVFTPTCLPDAPGACYQAFQTSPSIDNAAVAAANSGTGWLPGLNTIEFFVTNTTGDVPNPSGLRVEISGDATVPEPMTFGLMGAGLLGLGLLRRRFNKK